MEPDGSAQVAVFVDFENLVLGAVKELPDLKNPAPYEALTRLSRSYGNASVRRAYADWANPLFGSHQDDLAMNGVDLIQVARVGIQNKNAADIRMARSEEHTSELQSRRDLVCRLLLEKK